MPFQLSDEQKAAVVMAMTNRLSIITGGPGTGKTSILQAILAADAIMGEKTDWQYGDDSVTLMAPTGEADIKSVQLRISDRRQNSTDPQL